MCPRLLEVGPFTIYSYGLMLAIAFIVGSYLLTSEVRRRGLDPNLGNTLTLLALVGGVVGAKLLYLLENWSYFVNDPVRMLFSPGGLTFHGGFIAAALAIYYYTRKKRINFLVVTDAIAPALMLAYGIGRIGCHLAGDGDYGFPTALPWGTDYSKGTYPPSVAFQNFPELTSQYPGGVVPDTTPCHPTPIYEFIIAAAMFVYLWRIRKTTVPPGKLFSIYLILAGMERFAIEFMRLNPRIAFGLTQAQLISLGMIVLGTIGIAYLAKSLEKSRRE